MHFRFKLPACKIFITQNSSGRKKNTKFSVNPTTKQNEKYVIKCVVTVTYLIFDQIFDTIISPFIICKMKIITPFIICKMKNVLTSGFMRIICTRAMRCSILEVYGFILAF